MTFISFIKTHQAYIQCIKNWDSYSVDEQEQLRKWYRDYYAKNKQAERKRYRDYYAANTEAEKERAKKYKKTKQSGDNV